jgi:hypothetical protein
MFLISLAAWAASLGFVEDTVWGIGPEELPLPMGLMLGLIGDPLGIAGGVGDARVGAIGDAKVDRQPIVNTQTCMRVELHDAALSAAREARRCAFA